MKCKCGHSKDRHKEKPEGCAFCVRCHEFEPKEKPK